MTPQAVVVHPTSSTRRAAWALSKRLRAAETGEDFMRDELVDADIGYSAEELHRYANGRDE